MLDKKTAIQSKGPSLFFNNQDISIEAEMWTNAFVRNDFKRMGYIFADTLIQHEEVNHATIVDQRFLL